MIKNPQIGRNYWYRDLRDRSTIKIRYGKLFEIRKADRRYSPKTYGGNAHYLMGYIKQNTNEAHELFGSYDAAVKWYKKDADNMKRFYDTHYKEKA
jgi:hypothetical protein